MKDDKLLKALLEVLNSKDEDLEPSELDGEEGMEEPHELEGEEAVAVMVAEPEVEVDMEDEDEEDEGMEGFQALMKKMMKK